jgi:hypothetical protein
MNADLLNAVKRIIATEEWRGVTLTSRYVHYELVKLLAEDDPADYWKLDAVPRWYRNDNASYRVLCDLMMTLTGNGGAQ